MSDLQDRYNIARRAKTGSEIQCPVCLKPMTKTTYHKVFCSNQKTHRGRSSCKDKYWNTVNLRGDVGFDLAVQHSTKRREFEPLRETDSEYFTLGANDLDDGYYDENGE